MTQEASDFARKLEAQRPSYESVLQEAQDRSGSILTGRGAVREIVLQIGQLLTNEGRNIAEGLRRTAAAEVYTRIIDESRQKLEELSALRERIDLVERRLQRELEELSAQKGSRHPFRISVDVPASIRELSMDSRAFVDWLKESGGGFEGLLMKDANALTESFRAFGHAVPEVAKVATLTIDQVLERVSNKERMSYIERLDRMASPMWNYDDATVHAAHVPQKILLFGVQNLSKMILDPQEIKDSIPMTGPPNFAEVGDPERIYVYKVELVSPAFAITGMRRYSLAYNELRKRTPFHLEAGFDRDPARDLWPAVGGSEALRAWSLANAPVFGRMDQNGLHYSVRSERKGAVLDRHLVKLGQGRINASQKFVDDPELVEEVMESVRKVLNSRGIQAVMSELRSHSDALVQLGRRSSDPNARNLITSEIEAIDEFIAEHTTMI